MVARTWHGAVPVAKAEEYLELLRTVGLKEYKTTPGSRGGFVFRRADADVIHFVLLSFWESLESIEAYAGDDISVPQYWAFDPVYLIEMESSVAHHSVFGDDRFLVDGLGPIARMWHGAVPVEKSDSYLNLMQTVALDDYRSVPGNRGALALRQIAGNIAHFVMLTFWDSRDAIAAFAGNDIQLAKYYDFDRDFLVELEPEVKHYEVFGPA
jgi:heme-degrading monooxygenase HmoA